MIFQDFIHTIKDRVGEMFSADYDVSLQQVLKNNGVCYESLLIMQKGVNVSPLIYLNPYYHRYLNGMSIQDICDDICNVYYSRLPFRAINLDFFFDYDKVRPQLVPKLINYEKNREMLINTPHVRFLDLAIVFMYLFPPASDATRSDSDDVFPSDNSTPDSYDAQLPDSDNSGSNCENVYSSDNESLNSHNTHQSDFAGFSTNRTDAKSPYGFYRFNFGSVTIRNQHLDMWGITPDQLYEDALHNAPLLLPPEIKSMQELLAEFFLSDNSGNPHYRTHGYDFDCSLFDSDDIESDDFHDKSDADIFRNFVCANDDCETDPIMYVITNVVRINGAAAAVLYENILSEMAMRLDSNLVVLPSSVHEMIVVPTGGIPFEELGGFSQMVQEVNATQVADDEILSNNAYYYDAATKELSIIPFS